MFHPIRIERAVTSHKPSRPERDAPLRVAFVAPYLPAPEDTGGRIRMAQLARALRAIGDVELFACGGRAEARSPRTAEALAIYSRRAIRGRAPSLLSLAAVPERVKSATPALLAWDIARAHRARPFDVVVASHSYAMAIAKLARGAAIVLDEHNIESAYATATHESLARLAREHERLVRWERACWTRADAVTCVCAEDAREIARWSPRVPSVIANGVTLERVAFIKPSARRRAGRRDVLFVGLMSHGPNEEAAAYLAREVMPRVWDAQQDARLVLCGRQPSASVRALASSRVEVTGTVDNVGEYLSRAAVVTVPLLRGAGSSLKAVEALASGAPVVSTAVGMRGIDGARPGETHDEHDDPVSFASAIIAALRDDNPALDERAARWQSDTTGPRSAHSSARSCAARSSESERVSDARRARVAREASAIHDRPVSSL
jgi:glycosyltransferase involved in cell wall biosynthesis